MQHHVSIFARPKGGHSEAEYEDAGAYSEEGRWPLHVAVADGATESAFARVWAELLVERYVSAEIAAADGFCEQLMVWRKQWAGQAAQRQAGLPWYAAAKAEEGAFATWMGLTLYENQTWRALAVGDCCLFHYRDDTRVLSWPFTDKTAFTNQPALVSSRLDYPIPEVQMLEGTWTSGDRFILATDAIAAYLLDASGSPPILTEESVQQARAAGQLRNDDVTVLTVHL